MAKLKYFPKKSLLNSAENSARYTMEGRLSDVICLLTALALVENYAFRSNEGITNLLHSNPRSAKEWHSIVEEHPEFFRFATGKMFASLLIRSYSVIIGQAQERNPLTVDQTQKLIDSAIVLYEKEKLHFDKIADVELGKKQYRITLSISIITIVLSFLSSLLVAYFKSRN